MGNMLYCSKCEKEREIEVREEKEVYPVKGEETEILANVTYCKHCGKQIWNDEFEGENLKKAYKIYQNAHDLLLPEEIKAIREKYDLSQTLFAKILGLGEKTITRYENGSIQDAAQNVLIDLADDSEIFAKLISKAKNRLSQPEYDKAIEGVSKHRPKTKTLGVGHFPYQQRPLYLFDRGNQQYRCEVGVLNVG
jgi:putative zinc finger/helix-turn-helix YgiT family protein